MRTTLELPDELFRMAKIASVQRGTSLKELVTKALRRELGLEEPEEKSKRVVFPLMPRTGKVRMTPESVARADEESMRRDAGW
ncbi:MAG: antitoxin [Fimbriimonas sp.]